MKKIAMVLAIILLVPMNVSAWNYGCYPETETEECIRDMENQQEQQGLEIYRLQQEQLQRERSRRDGGRSLLY